MREKKIAPAAQREGIGRSPLLGRQLRGLAAHGARRRARRAAGRGPPPRPRRGRAGRFTGAAAAARATRLARASASNEQRTQQRQELRRGWASTRTTCCWRVCATPGTAAIALRDRASRAGQVAARRAPKSDIKSCSEGPLGKKIALARGGGTSNFRLRHQTATALGSTTRAVASAPNKRSHGDGGLRTAG